MRTRLAGSPSLVTTVTSTTFTAVVLAPLGPLLPCLGGEKGRRGGGKWTRRTTEGLCSIRSARLLLVSLHYRYGLWLNFTVFWSAFSRRLWSTRFGCFLEMASRFCRSVFFLVRQWIHAYASVYGSLWYFFVRHAPHHGVLASGHSTVVCSHRCANDACPCVSLLPAENMKIGFVYFRILFLRDPWQALVRCLFA